MPDPDDILSCLAAIAARNDDRAGRAGKLPSPFDSLATSIGLACTTSRRQRFAPSPGRGCSRQRFRFSRGQGLNGAAVSAGCPVVINDVRNDRRYLTTFGTTLAEAIVPVRVGDAIVARSMSKAIRSMPLKPMTSIFCNDALRRSRRFGRCVRPHHPAGRAYSPRRGGFLSWNGFGE